MENNLTRIPTLGPNKAIISCFKNFVTIKGRARRSEFWWFALLYNISFIPLIVTCVEFHEELELWSSFGMVPDISILLILILCGSICLFLSIVMISVGVRRLHDSGKSGWLMLVYLIPYIGPIALLVLFLLPSQDGTNEYGDNPCYMKQTPKPVVGSSIEEHAPTSGQEPQAEPEQRPEPSGSEQTAATDPEPQVESSSAQMVEEKPVGYRSKRNKMSIGTLWSALVKNKKLASFVAAVTVVVLGVLGYEIFHNALSPDFAEDPQLLCWVYERAYDYNLRNPKGYMSAEDRRLIDSWSNLGILKCSVDNEVRLANTHVVEWQFDNTGMKDTYNSYWVTYRVELEKRSLYVLINLIEFDKEKRWESSILTIGDGISDINNYIN